MGLTLAERFLRHVQKTVKCWIWTGALSKKGYGRCNWMYGSNQAHRASYVLFVGPIPPGKHVLHRCDNPPCVRPDHLFTGTNLQNVTDSFLKGRRHG